MVWVGAIIVVLTFAAIIKKYETRLVLFISGVAMAAASGKPMAAVDAFSKAMVNPGLVTVICTVMGFAFVMKLTKCDAHLVHLLAGALGRFRVILIPGTVIVTFLINIALPSAAGCGAAVGAIMIPTLIGAGVNPIMAACLRAERSCAPVRIDEPAIQRSLRRFAVRQRDLTDAEARGPRDGQRHARVKIAILDLDAAVVCA